MRARGKGTVPGQGLTRTMYREQIKDVLLERILNGAYEPGERIVETRVAREFGVSQGPVREALRQLEAQRLIERGEQPPAEMEQQLDTLLGQVQTSRNYQDMAVAQENFDKVMQRVNQWILEGIRKGAASPIITLG